MTNSGKLKMTKKKKIQIILEPIGHNLDYSKKKKNKFKYF